MFYLNCVVAVCILCLFLMVPWVCLQSGSVPFPGHTNLPFYGKVDQSMTLLTETVILITPSTLGLILMDTDFDCSEHIQKLGSLSSPSLNISKSSVSNSVT